MKLIAGYYKLDTYWHIFPQVFETYLVNRLLELETKTKLKEAIEYTEEKHKKNVRETSIQIRKYIDDNKQRISLMFPTLSIYIQNVISLTDYELSKLIHLMELKQDDLYENKNQQKELIKKLLNIYNPKKEIEDYYNFINNCQFVKIEKDIKVKSMYLTSFHITYNISKFDIIFNNSNAQKNMFYGDYDKVFENKNDKIDENNIIVKNLRTIYFNSFYYIK